MDGLTKIYFAHSYPDYDTEYEEKYIEKIDKWCKENNIGSYWLINPKDIHVARKKGNLLDLKGDIKKYFYPIIDTCDIVIVLGESDKGTYTICVRAEIEYAYKNHKRIVDIEHNKGLQDVYAFCNNCEHYFVDTIDNYERYNKPFLNVFGRQDRYDIGYRCPYCNETVTLNDIRDDNENNIGKDKNGNENLFDF